MADTSSPNPLPSPHLSDSSPTIIVQQHQSQNPNLQSASSNLPLISSSQPQQQQSHYGQPVSSPSLLSPSIQHQQIQHQQIQQSNASGLQGYQIQQNLQRSPSMSRLSQMNQLQQLNQFKQQQTLYGNFSAGNSVIPQSLAQNNPQQQQTHPLVSGANISRTAMMGQTGHLPMLSGPSQFNLQSPMMSPSPRQKVGLVQNTQLHQGNPTSQSLQGIQAMASLNMNPQLRANGSLAFAQSAQRLNPAQLRQLAQQNSLISNQMQNMQKSSSLAFMNSQLTGLPQNAQSALLQNTLSQQQWLKPMPSMSPSAASSLRMQQQRQTQALLQQQLASNQQIHHNTSILNPQFSLLTQQQPTSVNQQLHLQQQQQLLSQSSQQFQQASLLQHQQLSRVALPGGQKSISLTGSQPDATGSGSSSQGTEATNQLLGKRKIQDLVSQVDPNAKLLPEVEDLLLEFADGFIDSVTSFACNLAKHRKSNALESQDLLLHLEKNWKLTIPGYSSGEKKPERQPMGSEVHVKRLEYIYATVERTKKHPPIEMISQGNHFIRQSPSSDQLVAQTTSQALGQMTRY